MGKINVLTPNVFNMIAAGEVVERPASVVKELVENSIGAGATEISVDVEEGGIRRITVSDNGTGIDRDDIRAAFLPHATSKLEDISDLDTISTLGFRGEALASIASVSEVTLESRSRGSDMARKITLVAGKVVSEEDSGRWEGTAITVENLFFNTPARLKFLKKASAELGYIVDKIEKIVLANPSLKVRLTSERGVEIEHNGGSLEDAISSVYPEVDMTRLIPVERTSSGNIRVSGYVSDVEYTAPTRAKQTVIVNGRVVENDTVAAAIEKAYRDFLVKRTYPVFVLDIIVPFDEVEVNVHPTKAEVRFRNKSAVFGAVFRAVDEAVRSAFGGSVHGFDVAGDASEKSENRFEQTKIDTSALYYDAPPAPVAPPADSRPAARDYSTPFELGSLRNTGSYGSKKAAESAVGAFSLPNVGLNTGMDDAYAYSKISEFEDEDFANSYEGSFKIFDGTVLGQVFDTYLIVERSNLVYIIDQHAAHERVLYDKLAASLSPEYSQSLLLPHKLRLVGAEAEYFEKIMPALTEMGFVIEKKPSCFLVYAVPAPVARMNFDRFTAILFEHMLDDGELKILDLVKDVVCRDACRAAIKGGEHLTKRQIEYVIANLVDEEGNLPQKCPHGRPAVVALTRRDFEKMFKRIV